MSPALLCAGLAFLVELFPKIGYLLSQNSDKLRLVGQLVSDRVRLVDPRSEEPEEKSSPESGEDRQNCA